jgi:hypothetical protein
MKLMISLLCLALMAETARGAEMLPLRDGLPPTGGTYSGHKTEFSASFDASDEQSAPISPTKAALYSLLLPGLGDYKLNNKGRATAFFAAEGLIWISYGVFQVQGHQREDDYQELAVQFAGVSRTGHSDDFYARVREFDNSDQYEADVKNTGREEIFRNTHPPDLESIDPDALEAYYVDNRVSDFEPWTWQSLEKRVQYSETRSASKTSYRRADYMIAAALANRLVSAVVAYTAAHNVEPQKVGYHLDFSPAARGVDVSFALTRNF